MGWDPPFSSPVVSTVNVATSPCRVTAAVPLPVTWLSGNGRSTAWNSCPAPLVELPDVSTTTTTTTAAATATSPATAHQYRRSQPPPSLSGEPAGCSGAPPPAAPLAPVVFVAAPGAAPGAAPAADPAVAPAAVGL